MNDAEAKREVESKLPLVDAGLGSQLSITPEAARHLLQAIEDRAALVEACKQEDYLKPILKAYKKSERHMRGEP